MRIFARYLAPMALCVVGACAIPADTSTVVKEDKTVTSARSLMVGMSEAEVRMCAGFPTMGAVVGETEKIWTYQRIFTRGTMSVGASTLAVGPTPGLTGTTGMGAPGFCYTQVRFVDGRVREIEFAGDNNTPTAINGLCVSTVDQSVVYARRLRKEQPAAVEPAADTQPAVAGSR